MLEARGLTHRHPGAAEPALRGVDLAVAPGAVVGLCGPSGAGKSTLGRLLAGWTAPQAGSVTLDGAALPARGAAPVQLAHQTAALAVDPLWRLECVLENGGPVAAETLAALGVERAWLERRAHEVSGGQLQRVALARLLGPATRYLICDEITAALDALAAEALWAALRALCARRGVGLIVISHDPDLLALLTQRRLALAQGRLQEVAPG